MKIRLNLLILAFLVVALVMPTALLAVDDPNDDKNEGKKEKTTESTPQTPADVPPYTTTSKSASGGGASDTHPVGAKARASTRGT